MYRTGAFENWYVGIVKIDLYNENLYRYQAIIAAIPCSQCQYRYRGTGKMERAPNDETGQA